MPLCLHHLRVIAELRLLTVITPGLLIGARPLRVVMLFRHVRPESKPCSTGEGPWHPQARARFVAVQAIPAGALWRRPEAAYVRQLLAAISDLADRLGANRLHVVTARGGSHAGAVRALASRVRSASRRAGLGTRRADRLT